MPAPATSLLVAVHVYLKFVSSPQDGQWKEEEKIAHLFMITMKTFLIATLRHRGWLLTVTETIGDLSQPYECCCSLVQNVLLKFGGQAIIQVGLLWIPHSVERGKPFPSKSASCNNFAL